MNQKIISILALMLILTFFCAQTTALDFREICDQSSYNAILTLTYNEDEKMYSLEDLQGMDLVTGFGGRLNSVGSIAGPFVYKGVRMSTLASEFPSLSSSFTLRTIADDGYTVDYTEDEIHGDVLVYDIEGNEQGIGGVTMILAYEEEGISDFPGGPLRVAFVDDAEQLTDSFLWSKHVIEIEFFETSALNPPTIDGPASGESGNLYEYSFVSTDPDNLDISYFIDWGDGTNSGWIGPYSSSEEKILSHSWNEDGMYMIKAKAKNTEGVETDWSELEINMPKCKILFPPFRQFLEKFHISSSFLHKIIGM